MLLQFTVRNFKSFIDNINIFYPHGVERYAVKFSMLPMHFINNSMDDRNLYAFNSIDIFKNAVICGSNASGKSNLIKAMKYAQTMVVDGARVGKEIPYEPFKLTDFSGKTPSSFEFKIKGKCANYCYGFSVDEHGICGEYLYKFEGTTILNVFYRRINHDNLNIFDFCIPFKNKEDEQFLYLIAKGTAIDQLFLYEYFNRNIADDLSYITSISDVISWFRDILTIIFPNKNYLDFSVDKKFNSIDFDILSNELNKIDSGIVGLFFQKMGQVSGLSLLPSAVKENIINELNKSKTVFFRGTDYSRYKIILEKNIYPVIYQLMISHHNKEGRDVLFDINNESEGVQRMIDILPAFVDCSENKKVYIIDEFDINISKNITSKWIKNFLIKNSSYKQLIVTVSDLACIDVADFSSDQIWRMQKENKGYTNLYYYELYQDMQNTTAEI